MLTYLARLPAVLAFVCLCSTSAAQTLQTIPPLDTRVTDVAGVLSSTEKTNLEQLCASIEAKRGSQIAVLIVPSTQPEPIEDYANRVGNAWKLGRKGVGDGVLIVAALQDRKVRIEVARSLEGAIPDATAKRIIREVIAPEFKQGRYAAGLDAAVHRIDERLAQEDLPTPSAAPATQTGLAGVDFEGLLPFLLFGVVFGCVLRGNVGGLGPILSAVGAGGLAWFSGYAMLIAAGLGILVMIGAFLFSSMQSLQRNVGGQRNYGGHSGFPSTGGTSSWGAGSSGGGFSSGGGGDFGGGGSSGDW